jgi:hypothetical protein
VPYRPSYAGNQSWLKEVIAGFWGFETEGNADYALFKDMTFENLLDEPYFVDLMKRKSIESESVWKDHKFRLRGLYYFKEAVCSKLKPQQLMFVWLNALFARLGYIPDMCDMITSRNGHLGNNYFVFSF